MTDIEDMASFQLLNVNEHIKNVLSNTTKENCKFYVEQIKIMNNDSFVKFNTMRTEKIHKLKNKDMFKKRIDGFFKRIVEYCNYVETEQNSIIHKKRKFTEALLLHFQSIHSMTKINYNEFIKLYKQIE